MWETLYNVLFNPNHEMPVYMLLAICVCVVVVNTAAQRYYAQKAQRKRATGDPGQPRQREDGKK